MKVTYNPRSGEFGFEDVDSAVAFAERVQAGTPVPLTAGVPEAVKPTALRPHPELEVMGVTMSESGLSYPMFTTWKYLVERDGDKNPVEVQKIARALKCKPSAMAHRLAQLVNIGYAERVARGRYRAALP